MAQCFGLFPLYGIRGEVDDLRFSWKSWKILHTFTVLCGILFCDATCLLRTLENGIRMFKFGKEQNDLIDLFDRKKKTRIVGDVIFYTTNVVAIVCFLHIARDWPALMRNWKLTEECMSKRYRNISRLKFRLLVTTSVFLTAAISASYRALQTMFTFNNFL